jgi:hypothetical protein
VLVHETATAAEHLLIAKGKTDRVMGRRLNYSPDIMLVLGIRFC